MQTIKFRSLVYDDNLSSTIAFVGKQLMTVCLNQISLKEPQKLVFKLSAIKI